MNIEVGDLIKYRWENDNLWGQVYYISIQKFKRSKTITYIILYPDLSEYDARLLASERRISSDKVLSFKKI